LDEVIAMAAERERPDRAPARMLAWMMSLRRQHRLRGLRQRERWVEEARHAPPVSGVSGQPAP
jgi:hypothetical protein